MMGKLDGRVVVVLGAGSIGPGWGNGKACAITFAREGAEVVAVDVNGNAAEETAEIIRREGRHCEPLTADVTSESDVRAVVEHCIQRHGRIDVLHYNVGVCITGDCLELSEANWKKAFDLNVTGCFLACKHVLPVMLTQKSGVLLTTGSIAGLRYSGVNYISYYTTKAALIQFTRAIAMQYAKSGIRAVSVLPGLMNTPIIYNSGLEADYSQGDLDKMIAIRDAQCPTGKMGDAWDVANAALYLVSDEAKYVTATELIVDGGMTAKFA